MRHTHRTVHRSAADSAGNVHVGHGGEGCDGSDARWRHWRIATDRRTKDASKGGLLRPREEARPTQVPWIIQDAFPGYHGAAWY